jgi:hypothetical protein
MKTLMDYVKFLLSHSPCRALRTLQNPLPADIGDYLTVFNGGIQ